MMEQKKSTNINFSAPAFAYFQLLFKIFQKNQLGASESVERSQNL